MHCHGHSQVSHLALRPLSQSLPTMSYGRPNGECKAAVVDDTVAQYSVILETTGVA